MYSKERKDSIILARNEATTWGIFVESQWLRTSSETTVLEAVWQAEWEGWKTGKDQHLENSDQVDICPEAHILFWNVSHY